MTCPACTEKRRHSPEETKEFHEYAGCGLAEGRRSAPEEQPKPVKEDVKRA